MRKNLSWPTPLSHYMILSTMQINMQQLIMA